VEASFFLDVLDTFSSRKKYQIFFAPKESLGPKAKTNFLMLGVTHQAFYNFTPLIAAGALPFSVAKKDQAEAVRRDHEGL
jgi:hypothetical protein